MNKKNPEIVVTAIVCFGLVALVLWVYLGAVFGEQIPEKKREISVVLYDAGENSWESLEEGVRQAEEDFSVHVNFVIAKENISSEEQIKLIKQEIEDGAQGILWAVPDASIIYQTQENDEISVPIVTLESGSETGDYTYISADNYAMGKTLGEAILADYEGKDAPEIIVVEQYFERDSVSLRAKGFYDALGENAKITTVHKEQAEVELSLFLANRLNYLETDVVVALSKEASEALCIVNPETMEDIKVYGIGNTPSVVAALDKGKIEKLVFQNEFNIGYLGVEALLAQMNGLQSEGEAIDFYCVGKEDIHKTQYERLLFPIVE